MNTKKTNILSFVEKKTKQLARPKAPANPHLNREQLLKHYVREGARVLQSLDNLGNFLMGFGVLILGYLLNVDLKNHIQQVIHPSRGELFALSSLALLAWVSAILLLLGFIYLFVFHLLAGRAVYARDEKRDTIGERISIKKMSYGEFESKAPTFDEFIDRNYLKEDKESDEQVWYATFRYHRYMAFRKLMVMNKMRELLAWALVSGVLFKIGDILFTSL